MANTASARKRARQSEKRRRHNAALRSAVRTSIKKVQAAVATGDPAAAQDAFKASVPQIDKMVRKGILHKNKAIRHKSRLNAHIKGLAAKA